MEVLEVSSGARTRGSLGLKLEVRNRLGRELRLDHSPPALRPQRQGPPQPPRPSREPPAPRAPSPQGPTSTAAASTPGVPYRAPLSHMCTPVGLALMKATRPSRKTPHPTPHCPFQRCSGPPRGARGRPNNGPSAAGPPLRSSGRFSCTSATPLVPPRLIPCPHPARHRCSTAPRRPRGRWRARRERRRR